MLGALGMLLTIFGGDADAPVPDRSPVDLVVSADERWLWTANQTSNTVSVVDVKTGRVTSEVPCGERPSAIALLPDETTLLVSATHGGELSIFHRTQAGLEPAGSVALGFEPRGVAVAPDGRRAYVAQTTAHQVAVVDLVQRTTISAIEVGRWPRYLALSPDGRRLAVGANGDGGVAVVDTERGTQRFLEDFAGINLGQMEVSADGVHVYFPWMVYGRNPITPSNIRRGWVLASRLARVRLDRPARREAISLDPKGSAVSDPHGLALSPAGDCVVIAASGTHELLVFQLAGLPFADYGGPGDHIDPDLLDDGERFYRIALGGRPMAVRFAADGRRVYVANYLANAVQVVELADRTVARTIPLGGPEQPSLARRGEEIFYDGRRSLDGWYSCHSCHYEGHTNAVVTDTTNDGSAFTFKTVLSLRNVTRTGPWTWHGWQTDLRGALEKSLTETMLGPQPAGAELDALVAFLETLRYPPNPYRNAEGELGAAIERGKRIFRGARAGCVECHRGRYLTDGAIHRVGLEQPSDRYQGFNTPSLVGVYDRVRLLHDGRASDLKELLNDPHDPEKVTGGGTLSAAELDDLIAYLRSL